VGYPLSDQSQRKKPVLQSYDTANVSSQYISRALFVAAKLENELS
jgi:hypothetical protein